MCAWIDGGHFLAHIYWPMSRSQTVPSGPNGWSRRRFLQATTLAAGATALGFPNLLRARGLNERLQVGFIGLGGKVLSDAGAPVSP